MTIGTPSTPVKQQGGRGRTEARASDYGGTSHAGEYETSRYLALKPELVEMDKAVDERSPMSASFRTALLAESLDPARAERLASREGIVGRLRRLLASRLRSSYRKVINGTGVLLHTGLGRSVLPSAAVDAFRANHTGYSIVEVDGRSGERNQREGALSRSQDTHTRTAMKI